MAYETQVKKAVWANKCVHLKVLLESALTRLRREDKEREALLAQAYHNRDELSARGVQFNC